MSVTTKLNSAFITYSYIIQKKEAKCQDKKVDLETLIRLHLYPFLSHHQFGFEREVYSIHDGGLYLLVLPHRRVP